MNQKFYKGKKYKSLPIAIAVGLMVAIVFSITIIISFRYYQKLKTQQLQSELAAVSDNIRKIMTNSNLAAFSVGLTINPNQDTVSNFEYVSKEIMNRHP
jgi:predicted negative regulator of RcsB-dependent stress response